MDFLGDVSQIYTQKFNENGVLRTRKRTNGHQCNSCHEILLLSSVKTLQKILLERSAQFQKTVEIKYKPTLVESDQSAVRSFIKSPRSSLSSLRTELLYKRKPHLDIHIKLKGRFPKEKICLYGSPIVQVPGLNSFLNYFVD